MISSRQSYTEKPASPVLSSADNADAEMAAGLEELVNALPENRTFVFVAPTDVKKSTRLAPAVVDALGYTRKKVACNHPRHIATLQISDYVARKQGYLNSKSGPISHKFKGESIVHPGTRLFYVTDGSLVIKVLHGEGYLDD